jgi:tetratricopeptide (TPR) repeat protein
MTRRVKEAEEVMKQAHLIAPDDELVNRALASFYIVTRRAALAEPHLKKVAEKSNDPRSQLMLADYYAASNRRGDAIPILEKLAAEKNTYAKATLRLAQLDFAAGKRDAAEKLVDQVLAKEANNSEALVAKSRLRYAAGNYDAALESAREAVAADPRSVAALLALARTQMARRDNAAAAAAFKEALRLNPRIPEAQLELAKLELAGGSAESSVQLASRAVAAQPGNPEARLLLARGLMARGDLARAEQEMRLLESRYADVARVQAQMGILNAMKGDTAGARKSFERALQIDPKLIDAVAGLVSLDLHARNTAGAVATVEKQLAAGTPGADLLVLAGQTYAAANNQGKAEEMLRRAIDTDSANFQAYAVLGRLYLAQKRLDEARAEFDALTKKQPRSVAAHTMVATILDYQNRKPEAKQRYEQILAIDPEAPVASNNLAWMLAEGGGNLDIALQLAQTAVRRLPDNPDVSDTLGWVYYRKGLPSLSIPPFQKSVEKNPKNATYRYHLGLAYAKVGDVENARTHLNEAVTLDPSSKQAQEAREALKTLPG